MKRRLLLLIALYPLVTWGQEDTPASSAETFLFNQAVHHTETAGDLEKAAALWKRLVENHHENTSQRLLETAFQHYHQVLQDLGRHDEAKDIRREILKRFPQSAYAKQLREGAESTMPLPELFAQADLLGIWTSLASEACLEFLPDNRFQEWPYPFLDDLPTALGSYEFHSDAQLEITLPGREARRYEWQILGNELLLESSEGKQQRFHRQRRPFRFPKNLRNSGQLVALLNLKAQEVEAASTFVSGGGDPREFANLLASTRELDVEMKQLSENTPVALLVRAGLTLIDVATQAYTGGNVELGNAALSCFLNLHWDDWQAAKKLKRHVAPYRFSHSGVVGIWKGAVHGVEMTMTFEEPYESYPSKGRFTSSSRELMDELGSTAHYHLSGATLNLTGSGPQRASDEGRFLFARHDNRLAFYDDSTGELCGKFQSEAFAARRAALQSYFDSRFRILLALVEVSEHEAIQSLLRHTVYHLATTTEGTPAGVIARTTQRQLSQLRQAYLEGDSRRGTALARALTGSLQILIERRMTPTLMEIGIVLPDAPPVHTRPANGVYHGTTILRPVDSYLGSDLVHLTMAFRSRIAEENLIQKALETVSDEERKAFLEIFGDIPEEEILFMLENRLSVRARENGPRLEISAFRHRDPGPAAALGNQLAKLITSLPPTEDLGSWAVETLADPDLPDRLVLHNTSANAPSVLAPLPGVRGRHARKIHSPFVYQNYVAFRTITNDHQIRARTGCFLLVEIGNERLALKRNPGPAENDEISFTAITWKDGTMEKRTLKAKQVMGPGSTYFKLQDYPLYADEWLSPIEQDALVISAARTSWVEAEDIDFDHRDLLWYRLQR